MEAARDLNYRPEVDGLRALAVLAVLGFHLGVSGLHGGFVGVDVFFVISGFLITGMLARDAAAGRLSLRRFYRRRFWRLYPALAATVAASLAAGWFILTPAAYARLGESAVSALFAVSNVLFWSEAGYFDALAITKPLLHTWTLSLEWQFYAVWPLALVGLLRLPAPARWTVLGLVAAASLAASQALLRGHAEAAFYLLPFRAFEFVIGAGLALLPARLQAPGNKATAIAGALGLLLFAGAAIGFRSHTPFPGLNAVLPAAAAALLIAAGGGFVGALLRHPLAVWVGQRSYAIYLVHWPLISFHQLQTGGRPDGVEQAALFAASLALAAMLHALIEQPLRRRGGSPAATSRLLPTTAAALLVVVAAVVPWASAGAPWRYPTRLSLALSPGIAAEGGRYTWALFRTLDHPFVEDGRPRLLVIGDSQGADFVNLLAASRLRDSVDLAALPSSADCQIVFSPEFYDHPSKQGKEGCADAGRAIRRDSRIGAADLVVLAFEWRRWTPQFLEREMAGYREMGARRIVLVGRKDQGMAGADVLAATRGFEGAEAYLAAHPHEEAWQVNAALAAGAGSYAYYDLMGVVCPTPGYCRVVTDDQLPLFFDPNHLTSYGAAALAEQAMAPLAARLRAPDG